MQTEYGHLYLKKNVNVVGVYGLFENLPLNTKQIKITKDYKDFNPNYNYAALDVKSGEAPFVTVGIPYGCILTDKQCNYISPRIFQKLIL